MRSRILVVAPDIALRVRLARVLGTAGYRVELAESAAHARRIGVKGVALSIVAPEGLGPDGVALVAELRTATKLLLAAVPTGTLTSRADIVDLADDAALLARVADALRPHPDVEADVVLSFGEFHLDLSAQALTRRDGREIPLTGGEFRLLQTLTERPRRVLSRDTLLRALSGRDAEPYDRSVDMLVMRLRRKIEANPKCPLLLVTIPGSGYKFTAEVEKLNGPLGQPPVGDNRQTEERAGVTGKTPVVAVLPFVPFGPDQATRLVAEGIFEDLMRMLSSLREPAVISSNSTRNLRPGDADLSSIGQRLGAGYLLCGSVRLYDGKGRVIVELVDAPTGTVLWGDAYDVEGSRLFEAQEHITARIVHALAPRVNASELRRSLARRPADLDAYHLLLRARDLVFRLEQVTFTQAGLLIDEALRREPGYPAAYAARADWLSLRIFQGWSSNTAADTASLTEAAEMAIRLDPYQARALALLGHNRMLAEHRFEEAEALVDRAIKSAPNDAEVLAWSSPTCAYIGRTKDAIQRAEWAILLSPQDPFLFRFEHFLSLAYYAAEDCEQAAFWGLRSWRGNQNYTSNLRITIAALSALGRFDEATPMVERHCVLHPKFRSAAVATRHTFRLAVQREQFAARLGAAGLP